MTVVNTREEAMKELEKNVTLADKDHLNMKLYIFKNTENMPEYAMGNLNDVQAEIAQRVYKTWIGDSFDYFIDYIKDTYRIELTPVPVGSVFRKNREG